MKKIFILGLIIIGFTSSILSQVTYTWTGATDDDFFTSTNWNPTTGTPGSGDDVIFNSGSANCNITAGITIRSCSLLAGYTGVIDMGSSDHLLTGNLVVNSGTLTSTTGILEMDVNSGSASFSFGGGVFNNNGGSLDVYSNAGTTFAFSGNIVLNVLNLNTLGGTATSRIIDFGTNLSTTDLILNSTGSRVYTFQGTTHIKNSLDMGNSSHTTTLSTNNATLIFDGSSASLIGSTSAGAGKAYLPNIEINTTGAFTITRSINLLGNWTGTQGTLTLGTSTVNMYGSSAAITGTAAAFDNLTIQTGAVISTPASAEIKVGGTLTRTGTLNFQTTTILGLNGSGAQSLGGSSLTLGGLHIHSGSRTITLSTGLNILDSVKVDASATFATGSSQLTLRSTSGLTARLAEMGAGASITGNVIVQTLIPGGSTGWANLGVRGVSSQLVSSWDTYSTSAGANGIPMTCVGCAYSPTVLGTGSNSFVSIQAWDESGSTYVEQIAGDPLTPAKGFWVYVGDGATSSSNLTLINTGALVTGPVSAALTSGGSVPADVGFNLIANPYASPISWNKTLNFGANSLAADATIYVWNADLGGGAGGFTSYNQTTSTSSPGGAGSLNDVIPAGQGFYVFHQAIPGFDQVDFGESVKVDNSGGSNPLLKTASANSVQRFRLKLAGATDWDATVFCFHPQATSAYDRKYDGHKIFQSAGYAGYPGPYSKYTTISSKDAFNSDYSINTLPPLTTSLSVPVLARVSTSGTYTISAYDFNEFNMCVGLIDKLDNSYHDLRQSPYVCTISDTTSAARFEVVMCRDEATNQTGISEQLQSNSIFINQDQEGAFVKTAFAKNTKATISVFNVIGQKLMKDIEVEGTATSTRLNLDAHNQVVLIRVVADREVSTKKIIMH